MKKLALLCAVALIAAMLPLGTALLEQAAPVRVYGLVGPTGMSLAPLIAEDDPAYEYSLAAAPEELVGIIAAGGYDIAALPTNLAAMLYQKTQGRVRMLAINTLGVLYVMEKGDSIREVADLAGKTITLSGQAAVPEYALHYILSVNGVDANLNYKGEHNEVSTLAASGLADIVLLPQPMVTALLMKDQGYRIALDLTEEFKKAAEKDGKPEAVLSMGCLVVRAGFADERPQDLQAFLTKYSASVEYVNHYPALAAIDIVAAGILPNEKIAENAIPLCNIVYVAGDDMRSQLSPLFEILFAANPASVGGQVPDEGFYYLGK